MAKFIDPFLKPHAATVDGVRLLVTSLSYDEAAAFPDTPAEETPRAIAKMIAKHVKLEDGRELDTASASVRFVGDVVRFLMAEGAPKSTADFTPRS